MKNPFDISFDSFLNIPFKVFCLAFCLILPAAGGAMGRKDLPRGEVTVTGRVRLVGTAMFNDLVISDDEGRDWHVEGPDREKLALKEQQQVTVKGNAETQDIILANGKKAGVRFILRDIRPVEE
jgi:hypothetical protein